MSTLKVNAIQNTSGVTQYLAKAWVNWDASSGTPTIRASGNVSSLTDNGVGDTSVNFTNAVSDANYSTVATTSGLATGTSTYMAEIHYAGAAPTTSAVRILTGYAGVGYDLAYNNVVVFR